MEENKPKKKVVLIIALLFLFCSLILIGVGIYFYNSTKPIKIVERTFTDTTNYLKSYIFMEEDELLKNDFTIDSDIKVTIKSDYVDKLSENDDEYKIIKKMLNKLSSSKTELHLERELKEKKLFVDVNNSVGTSSCSFKGLITNSTSYYQVGNITKSYINSGTNNYFETLTNEATTRENNEYLYDFITSKIPTYLEEKDIQEDQVETIVADKEIKANKLTVKLTNDFLNRIRTNLYNDLKNDSKAKSIIEGYDSDFFKKKLKNASFFSKDEGMDINVYTTTLMPTVVKIEFDYSYNTEKEILSYEKVDKEKALIKIRSNDKELYRLNLTNKEGTIEIKVSDNKDNNIGTISFNRDNNGTMINIDINDDRDKIKVAYQSKKTNKKKTSYKRTDSLSIQVIRDKTTNYDIKVVADSKVKASADINENIDEAVLEKKLDEQTKEKIKNYLTNYIQELSK